MECKNCLNQLANNQKFCSECGGKVILERITFKSIFNEILDKFFNIDNKFYQTFLTLLKQPQEVVGGYIDGKRSKYFNPISYFAFSLTLSGIYFYLMQKGFIDYNVAMNSMQNAYETEMQKEIATKINKFVLEYSNVITILFIPIYVLFTKILFSKAKSYNWAEHFIVNIYLYSEASIITTLLLLLSVINTKILMTMSMLSFLLQFIYFVYSLKKVFDLSWKSIMVRIILFFGLLFLLLIFIFILGIAFGYYLKKNNLI
ncbi:conserved membrane hypothetical protein [Flavobacterium sp. 9AF]|uniref:DUF3667 domain-containing protein n=1 Tax=Flavobacterium sp. 9AF TaxID=2653142 RepID=UPI0012F41665|nr:DUF3667 domain-containing protein [Flavobacterium sp. 9AF]VXC15795.1 conserved membrane hypothetical protein [Flavobacterium sp. 9AF]